MQTEHYMANMGRTEPSDRFGHLESVDDVAGPVGPQGGASGNPAPGRSSGAHPTPAEARPDPLWSHPGGL